MVEPQLPPGLVEGRHTPLFGEDNLPGPLGVVHRTTVWATLHVQLGSVRYVDLAGPDARDLRLVAGDSAVIAPGIDHQIEPSSDATFLSNSTEIRAKRRSARRRRFRPDRTDGADRGSTGAGTSTRSSRSSRW